MRTPSELVERAGETRRKKERMDEKMRETGAIRERKEENAKE